MTNTVFTVRAAAHRCIRFGTDKVYTPEATGPVAGRFVRRAGVRFIGR